MKPGDSQALQLTPSCSVVGCGAAAPIDAGPRRVWGSGFRFFGAGGRGGVGGGGGGDV